MAFQHTGGSLHLNGQPLSREDAEWALDLFRELDRAGFTAGDLDAARAALHRSNELSAALMQQDKWRRASGGVPDLRRTI